MPRSHTGAGVRELLVPLRRDDPTPLHRQVGAVLRDAIRSGRLAAGARVPPSRALADDLGISRGVVLEAYRQLTAEGYLVARRGGHTQVADVRGPGATPPPAPAPRLDIDMRYGRPDVAQFPRAAWGRSLRRALDRMPTERLVYLDGQGAVELRTALAEYLNRARATWIAPDRMVVTVGFAQGFALICRVLQETGVRRLAVEDPSFDDIRPVATRAGLEVVGIPVDEDGIAVDRLVASGAGAVLVAPAHQLTGAVLGAVRRQEMVDWARRTGALIVEDDYDAEHRYDHEPIGAIQGLAPEQVVYAGSASKTLAPGLRLGWLAAPERLVAPLAAAKLDADRGSPVLDQLAFADFIAHGEVERHLRRMRPRYRARRDALLAALATHLPDVEPAGVSAGLHLLARLPAGLDDVAVAAAAARLGVGVDPLTPHRIAPGGPGLILGFARCDEARLEQGVIMITRVIAELRGGPSP